MFKHFIAVSSVYSKGLRIAWHYTSEKYDPSVVQSFLNDVKDKLGEVQLGIHRISTKSLNWDSVVESDSFFRPLIVFTKKDEFLDLMNTDQSLSAMDVAKFILSLKPISHLKLQKLIYLSYEKYLLDTGRKLFNDEIVAWKHGPVVKSLYHKFKDHGSNTIRHEEDDSVLVMSSDFKTTASLAKIFASEDGLIASTTIIETLKEYSHIDAWDLVEITHKNDGPWHKVFNSPNTVITDEVILSCYEAR